MRLYLMQLATAASGAPVPGYLIQTDDGSNVLVDTGFPESMIGAYREPGGEGRPRVDEGDWVVNQLASIGVAPGDIRYLVCTHLDPDHAGSHDRFPEAALVIQRAQYEAARRGTHPRYDQARPSWDHPRLRYRLLDGDSELLPGIELIETSGHVPGHQAVLVRLPQTGPVLLAIDAIPRALGDFTPETRPIGPFDLDEAGVRASTRKLVDLARREGVALIVHGHDAEQWRGLKKLPGFYA
ncbi:MAG: N-acyl homoserine lactonase family protein [Chloroflexota bacterium]|nr:N-acyl homoserine lactonase family protein [Chloroflexota bacterium]